jgi:hypothetical protein
MEEELIEQNNNRPWLFKKGQSGNPAGRPPGSKSLKGWVKDMLLAMTDEERMEFIDGLPKNVIWEMAEGKAQTNTDITSGGKPIPLLNYVRDNNSNKEDTGTNQENTDSTGGNISE